MMFGIRVERVSQAAAVAGERWGIWTRCTVHTSRRRRIDCWKLERVW